MPDDDLVECRLCGTRWRSLGHHLRHGHKMSADDYRDRFGIRRGEPLTSQATRARFQQAIRQTIAAGALAEHYAGNGARAGPASAIGHEVRHRLVAAGLVPPFGAPATPRAVIEGIVVAIEAGAKVATAVKQSPIVYSAFHAGLGRHPDLKIRVEAAKRRRR